MGALSLATPPEPPGPEVLPRHPCCLALRSSWHQVKAVLLTEQAVWGQDSLLCLVYGPVPSASLHALSSCWGSRAGKRGPRGSGHCVSSPVSRPAHFLVIPGGLQHLTMVREEEQPFPASFLWSLGS